MRLLELCVASPLAAALGWTLLHSLWEGALIAAALTALLLAVRSPRVRYAAACAALLTMLIAFGVTLVRVVPETVHSQRVLPLATGFYLLPGDDTAAPNAPGTGLAAIVPWLAPCWVVGVWLFYLTQVAGWITVRRMRRRGVCAVPEHWRNELARLAAHVRVSRPVALLESCLADVPIVLGHFRPVILVPAGLLAGMPAAQMEAILLHELAHIRRCDYLVNLLQRAVEGLLFYHPAVWWISQAIRAEREKCCDDVAVAIGGDAHEYAAALAALEESRWSSHEPALAATGGNLVMRIRRLLYPQGPATAWAPLLAALLFTTTAGLAVAAWHSDPAPPDPAAAQQQLKRELAAPYKKWVDEDVVYIIDEKERTAFQKLTTNEERKKFIEQFWLRRDPTPGTPENEFKEEHYRRIAYANDRYPGGKPGWKTDRGRIYIQLGPPDEIDSHPSGGADGVPFESWLYHHVGSAGQSAVFTFIDVKRMGDYELRKTGQGQGVGH